MDPAHAAQYNWQRIREIPFIYRLNIDGNIHEGPFFSIDDEDRDEGIRSGYLSCRKRWYAVEKLGNQLWSLGSRELGSISRVVDPIDIFGLSGNMTARISQSLLVSS